MPNTVQPIPLTTDVDRLSGSYAGVAGATVTDRIILSLEVPDVDAVLTDVERLGGTVTGGPNDMPWASASPTSRIRTATVSNPTPTRPI